MTQNSNPTDGLQVFRDRINELDDTLIDVLARRLQVCAEVAEFKRLHSIPMMQPERVEAVKDRCSERARARGLDGAFARDLYDRIIGEACLLETRIIEA